VLKIISQPSSAKSDSNGSNLIAPIPTLPPSAHEADKNRRVDIKQSNDGVTLTIDDRFVFPSGSANISAEGARTIERLVPLLRDLQGIDEDRIGAVGVAHTRPIAANATELGRSQNRRVEIQVRKR
jgi:flagellar motor protein MotB